MPAFEVWDKVKVTIDDLPYAGIIISYTENELYTVSVLGRGDTVQREASEIEAI